LEKLEPRRSSGRGVWWARATRSCASSIEKTEKTRKKKTEASSASFAWPATLAAAPPSAEAVEIPGRAIAEIVRARPTLRVLVDALDAEGRLR